MHAPLLRNAARALSSRPRCWRLEELPAKRPTGSPNRCRQERSTASACRVEVNGTLTLPLEKGQTIAKTLNVAGTSVIDYYERVLTVNSSQQAKTTARMYRKLEFQRKVGDQTQASTLRPEVRRLVIVRHNQVEVPFSPDGAMTWNEMDLIRTDVFTPALPASCPFSRFG